MTGNNDKAYKPDALVFSTGDCSSIISSLPVIFVKKSLLMYGKISLLKSN